MRRVFYDVIAKYSTLDTRINDFCVTQCPVDYESSDNFVYDFDCGFAVFQLIDDTYFLNCGFINKEKSSFDLLTKAIKNFFNQKKDSHKLYAMIKPHNKESCFLSNALGFALKYKVYEYGVA